MKKIFLYYRSLEIEMLLLVTAGVSFTAGFFYAIVALTEPIK